jgi:polyvinyl alcohol dehydrogenase (cytochrome)
VIWEYDTVREFDTVNGVAATGGSMGAAGPVAAAGRLVVPSGYIGVKNGMAGNVLLAFAPYDE